jgi:hypothetical protein
MQRDEREQPLRAQGQIEGLAVADELERVQEREPHSCLGLGRRTRKALGDRHQEPLDTSSGGRSNEVERNTVSLRSLLATHVGVYWLVRNAARTRAAALGLESEPESAVRPMVAAQLPA